MEKADVFTSMVRGEDAEKENGDEEEEGDEEEKNGVEPLGRKMD